MPKFYVAESVRTNQDTDSRGLGNKGHWSISGITNSLVKKLICLERPFKKVRLLPQNVQFLAAFITLQSSQSTAGSRQTYGPFSNLSEFTSGPGDAPLPPLSGSPSCSTRTPNPLPRERSTPNHPFQICWSLLRMFGLMH